MILSFKKNSDEIKVNRYSIIRNQFYRAKNRYIDTMELTNKNDDKVYKTKLQALYDKCLTFNEIEYTQESQVEFKIALDNVSAIQEEVDNAVTALQNAKEFQ